MTKKNTPVRKKQPNKFHPMKVERLITDINELIILLEDPTHKKIIIGNKLMNKNREEVTSQLRYLRLRCREFLANKNVGKFEVVYTQQQMKRVRRAPTTIKEMKL